MKTIGLQIKGGNHSPMKIHNNMNTQQISIIFIDMQIQLCTMLSNNNNWVGMEDKYINKP